MANLPNLNAEVGADYIGDDAQPALTFRNTGSGPGLRVFGVVATSTVSLDALALSGNITGPILAANATITRLNVEGASRASVPAFALKTDAFVSAVSLIFAAGAGWAGMGAIRVAKTDGTFGWIPVLPDGQVTAAAVP